MITYLELAEVLALHEVNIQEFGGSRGLRDLGLLESAVNQPKQEFGGQELYPLLWDKVATLGFSISENQPFLDGNKRTAALSMMVFLDLNRHELAVQKGEAYKAVMKVANKKMNRELLAQWLKANSKPI